MSALEASVMKSSVIEMDDTWMKVGRETPGKMYKGHVWPVLSAENEIVFCYTHTRTHEAVKQRLGNYKGTALRDTTFLLSSSSLNSFNQDTS